MLQNFMRSLGYGMRGLRCTTTQVVAVQLILSGLKTERFTSLMLR
jgi:hypothetical protein